MKANFEIDLNSLSEELAQYEGPLTEKQRDILAAAEDLFAKNGFAETPTAEIAREAGVTEKTLFKHFQTKAHLFKRVLFPILLKTLLPVQFQKMKKILNKPHERFDEAFTEIAQDRLAVALQFGPKLKLVFQELMQNDSFRKKFGKIWHDNVWLDMLGSVDRFQKNGQIRPEIDTATAARVQFYVIAGYILTRTIFLRSNKKEDDEAEIKKLLKIISEGLCVPANTSTNRSP